MPIFNMVGGGAGSPDLNGSTIRVTGEVGAVVTAQRGSILYSATIPASGTVDFVVRQSGHWILTAVKGTKIKNDYVDVLEDETVYEKNMIF